MSRPGVPEWLYDHGHMGRTEFVEWVQAHMDDVDEEGVPVGLERAIRELEGFREELIDAIRRETSIKDLLLPKPQQQVSKEEATKVLVKRQSLAWHLSIEIRQEYLHRELVIINTSKQMYVAGEVSEPLDFWQRRQIVEKAYGEAVGV